MTINHAIFGVMVLPLMTAVAGADELLVPAEYPAIQAAIEAASDGDRILVSPGIYQERINFLGKRLEITSTHGPTLTRIDAGGCDACEALFNQWVAEGSVGDQPNCATVVCDSGEPLGTLIEGFEIAGGCDFDDDYEDLQGGGFHVIDSWLEIRDCRIIDNEAYYGTAGLYTVNSTVIIEDCEFYSERGATIWQTIHPMQSMHVEDSVLFLQNSMFNGGGVRQLSGQRALLAIDTAVLISDCTFIDQLNIPTGSSAIAASGEGGGFIDIDRCYFAGNNGENAPISTRLPLTVTDTLFDDNGALYYGAMTLRAQAEFERCVFRNNRGYFVAGAVTVDTLEDVSFINCLFEGNGHDRSGGAVNASPTTSFENCTFVNNICGLSNETAMFPESFSGGAITGPAVLMNCVAVGNTMVVDPDTLVPDHFDTATVTYSLISDPYDGMGNVIGLPDFANPIEGDFRLRAGSLGIDRGFSDAIDLEQIDLAGLPRFVDDGNAPNLGGGLVPYIDMGAYEYQAAPITCPWDCAPFSADDGIRGDGEVNVDDFFAVLQNWGECPVGQVCPWDCAPDGTGATTVGDLEVDFLDFFAILQNWGSCPE